MIKNALGETKTLDTTIECLDNMGPVGIEPTTNRL
jgi:hypothetical protein